MLIQLNDSSENHPPEWSLLHRVVQVVNEYSLRGEQRLRLCIQEGVISRTLAYNGSVQRCCNLCKSTKLNIIKAKFFFKDLDSHLLCICTMSMLCSRIAFPFSAKGGKTQDPSSCQKINNIRPYGGSYARKFWISTLVVLRSCAPFCFGVMCTDY